jgi:protease-4
VTKLDFRPGRARRVTAIAALTTAAVLGASACGRPRSSELDSSSGGAAGTGSFGTGEVLELDLAGSVPESTDTGGLFPLPASRTFAGLLRAVQRAEKQEGVTGFFVKLGSNTEIGLARSEELGKLFERLKAAKKPVVCHAHEFGNATAWLAARGCDRIWLSPGGGVDTVGIASQIIYFKRALEKLEVHADFLQVGKFKGASEPFTREGPSDEARESLTGTLTGIRQSWLDGAATARKAPGIKDSLENGPWTAAEAKGRGLVDAIGYESEAREDAKQRASAGKVKVAFGPSAKRDSGGITEIIRILAGAEESSERPRLAVVPLEGSISQEAGGFLFDSGGITEKATSKTLRRLAKDDGVKAVVLRIDSPGGSALASDLIWNEVMELKKKKPVITSMGDLAASGGYYIACASTRIVANSSSIVGSIGVVAGKFVLDDALDRYGIDSVTFAASPAPGAAERAAYLSALTPWDDATRRKVLQQMRSIYDLFIDRCAKGRNLNPEQIKKSAEGRIFSGTQAKERGLVDEIGGLERAIALGRELAKLDAEAPVVIEGAAESLLEMLTLEEDASEAEVTAAWARLQKSRKLAVEIVPRELLPYAGSMSALLGGERVLTALPFGLIVK